MHIHIVKAKRYSLEVLRSKDVTEAGCEVFLLFLGYLRRVLMSIKKCIRGLATKEVAACSE